MESENEQIQFLRGVAKDVQEAAQFENHHLVIRYKHRCQYSGVSFYEYATALPLLRKSTKRNADEYEHQSGGHCRWLSAGEKSLQCDVYDERYRKLIGRGRWIDTEGPFTRLDYGDGSPKGYLDTSSPNIFEYIRQDFENRAVSITAAGELICKREYEYIQNFRDHLVFWPSMYETNSEVRDSNVQSEPFYKMIYGDVGSAALFALDGLSPLIDLAHPERDDIPRMFTLFETGKIDHNSVVRQLSKYFRMGDPKVDPYLQCTKGISTAATLYKKFANATVDVRFLQRKLYQSKWLLEATCDPANFGMMETPGGTPASLLPYKLDRACAFACIAMFESGLYDSDPKELGNVMAMSSGDSIYASVALLRDPSEDSDSHEIARVRGNIGRPGIAYLVPPRDPLITKVAISEWPNISRENFDGQIKDSFHSTSLHLSFTGAQSRVNLEFSGAQDDDVYMLETLISLFDKGRWIADLDPLRTSSSERLRIIRPCGDKHRHHSTANPRQQMTSIENWLQLIDAPDSRYAIVQAHGNWEARLAASSVSVALGLHTLVLPREVCWECFEGTVASVCHDRRQQNIVIA